MKQPKRGRFHMSVTEEMVMNRDYDGYCGGRIEVYDTKLGGGYHHYEGRFFMPSNLLNKFREFIDGEHDLPIMIKMLMKIVRTRDVNRTAKLWETWRNVEYDKPDKA